MAGNGETEGPIDGLADADARGHEGLLEEKSVTANLKRRGRICEVQSVKRGTNDGERLAKSAGAGGKLAGEALGERAIPVRCRDCGPSARARRRVRARGSARSRPALFVSQETFMQK